MPRPVTYADSFRTEVSRLARKEAKSLVGPLAKELARSRKTVTAQRKDLAELQRNLKALTRLVKKQVESTGSGGAGAVEEHLGEKWRKDTVRSTRRKLGVTQGEFATLLQVSIGAVSGWENGRTEPRERWKQEVLALRKLSPQEAATQLDEA